jgi:hypothetical protein
LLRLTAVQKQTVPRRALAVLTLLAPALVMALVLASPASATTTTCTNPDTLGSGATGSAFEIDDDANLIVDNPGTSTDCIDWLTGGTGTPFRNTVRAKNDLPTGSSDDSFGQGTAEDNANPTIVDGSIPPNKSDLKAFGVNTEDVLGTPNDFLELFWSRVQNPSGTTNMDFELNKEFCDGTPTHCANNGSAKNPVYVTPKRSVGDKLITYDLSKGGTVPTISIRTWGVSGWSSATTISGGANPLALGSINTSLIPAAETGGATGGLTTALGSQDPFTFGETAISFQALFGSGACGTFGSAYLKSRSSDSFTAEIKDFVAPEQVQVSNCPSSLTTNATASATVGDNISDTATLNVPAGAGGTITFHLYKQTAGTTDCAASTEVSTGLSPVTVNGPGTYNSGNYMTTSPGTYFWIATYSGDPTNHVDGSTTACKDANETTTVNQVASSMTSAQSFIPNDSATVSAPAGGNLAGSMKFEAFESSDCSGTAIYTQTVGVSGASPQTVKTTNTTVSTTAANVSWQLTYTSTNGAQKSIPANCFEKTALSINNDGTISSP